MGCLLQGAHNQRCSLLQKGREARRKRSHIDCAAKNKPSPSLLTKLSSTSTNTSDFQKKMESMNKEIGTLVGVFLPAKREKV